MTTKTSPKPAEAPALPADIEAALRRLRLAGIRRGAPDIVATATAQRWRPQEFLRALLEVEAESRDAANRASRLKAAGFPIRKTIDAFDTSASSIPEATIGYLVGLEWLNRSENLCLVGPAGTGKSHLLVALGHAAVESGARVRYWGAIDLIETLYRGYADNTVGRIINQIAKADLVIIDEIGFAPLDTTGAQLLFRLVAALYEKRSIATASHWPFEDWGHFLPDETTAVSLLDRLLHHATIITTTGESYRMRHRRKEIRAKP